MLIKAGELVCTALVLGYCALQCQAACVTRATSEVSMPWMWKFWPLMSKKMLPTTPGLKKAIWTSSQFSLVDGAVPLQPVIEEFGLPADLVVGQRSDGNELGT